jgi:hypothetical protein
MIDDPWICRITGWLFFIPNFILTDIMVWNPSDRSASRGATYKEYATSKPITDFAVSLIRLLCPEYLSDYYLPPSFLHSKTLSRL